MQFADGMADGRAHARATVRFDGADAALDMAVIGFGKLFHHKKIHLLATVPGKAVDGIGIAEPCSASAISTKASFSMSMMRRRGLSGCGGA